VNIHQILKTYWGYDQFRPLQEDIIQSVLSGKDTLALLPTGGGKSICFQVPGLALEGLCLVISPLIALMKDQVENLNKIGVPSNAIFSGLHHNEIEIILNNCVNGGVKFLYLSPERLGSNLVKDFLVRTKIGLLAIDEAHCISQWGFDFRPDYRKILAIRELMPGVPVMALTATATINVVDDIQDQLGFKQKNSFRKSFERLNLHYVVRYHENKLEKLLNSLATISGSGLVYTRNRKQTEEIAQFLIDNSINASFYHAGLESELRQKRQEDWIKNKTRIMICTNAFGMGIDKPDCKFVIHYQIPDCLEAYYQEAGRAGRNDKNAYCLLMYHPSDAENMRAKLIQNYPEEKVLKRVYNALCSYLQIPVGVFKEEGFDFDISLFSKHIQMSPVTVLSALKILSQLDIIHMSEALNQPSRIKAIMKGSELYAFQVEHEQHDDLIKIILRTYGGLFDNYVPISEKAIAMKINCSMQSLQEKLNKLHLLRVFDYIQQKNKPQLFFKNERVDSNYLKLNQSLIADRKAAEENKLEAIIQYAENEVKCRSRVLLSYFDEKNALDCGTCDICKEKLKSFWSEPKILELVENLKKLDWTESLSVKQITKQIKAYREDDLVGVLRILLDRGILQLNSQQQINWIKES
jgi:ATP-dependent DNA helicase RecQ